VGAGALLWVLPLPLSIQILGFVLVSASAWYQIRQQGLRQGRGAIQAIELPEDTVQPVTISTARGDLSCWPGAIYAQSSLALLQLNCAGGRFRRTLMLTADSLEEDTFRQLRARLLRRTPVVA